MGEERIAEEDAAAVVEGVRRYYYIDKTDISKLGAYELAWPRDGRIGRVETRGEFKVSVGELKTGE